MGHFLKAWHRVIPRLGEALVSPFLDEGIDLNFPLDADACGAGHSPERKLYV